MTSKPLIGVTSFRTKSPYGYPYLSLTESYTQALSMAGALPVMVPLGLSEDDLDQLRLKLDGLILSGGGDIDPAVYGGEPHSTVDGVDPDRDRVELHLARQFADTRRPVLGICRGFQVFNVALGGTLYTDIRAQFPGAIAHDLWPGRGHDKLSHQVRVEEETHLADILGQPLVEVNSLHHQGVKDLAPGLTPTAFSADGLIEGFELPEHPFGLAVQWHPERLTDQPEMLALFQALADASANGHA
jgi:putative glutamine amidotransferase